MGKRMTFVVTTKGRAEVLPLAALWPYGVMMGLNIAAIVIGLARFAAHPYAIAVNIFWVCYHMFILWNILYFNQLPELGREETASWHA
jgi:hypothetical protein